MKTILSFIFILFTPIMFYGQDLYEQAQYEVEQKQFFKAEHSIKKYLLKNEESVKAKLLLGEIYAHQKEWEKSSQINKVVLDSDMANAEYHYRYGGTLGLWAKNASKFKALFLLDDVKYHLKKAADLDENHIDTRWALIKLYMELPVIIGGSKKTAECYAKELKKISAVDAALAFAYIEDYDGNFLAAEKYYKQAVLIGNSKLTHQKLIDLYQENNQHQKQIISLIEAYLKTKDSDFLKQLLNKNIKSTNLSAETKNKFKRLFEKEFKTKETQLVEEISLKFKIQK